MPVLLGAGSHWILRAWRCLLKYQSVTCMDTVRNAFSVNPALSKSCTAEIVSGASETSRGKTRVSFVQTPQKYTWLCPVRDPMGNRSVGTVRVGLVRIEPSEVNASSCRINELQNVSRIERPSNKNTTLDRKACVMRFRVFPGGALPNFVPIS